VRPWTISSGSSSPKNRAHFSSKSWYLPAIQLSVTSQNSCSLHSENLKYRLIQVYSRCHLYLITDI